MDIHLTEAWVLIAGIAAVLLLCSLISYWRVESSASAGKRLLLMMLRVVAVGAALVMLLDPHQVEQDRFREPVELAILVDASASMQVQDIEQGVSRWESARKYVDSELRPVLRDDYDPKVYVFAESLQSPSDLEGVEPNGRQSNLAGSLEAVLSEGRNVPLGGVAVLSDGQFDDDESLRKAARKLRKSGIPLFTLTVGRNQEAADISLTRVSAEQIVPFEPRVRLTMKIDSPGYEDGETTVSVRRGERLLYERRLELTGKAQEETIEFVTPFRGFSAYDVALSHQDGERLDYNNARSVGVNVLDQKIHVLYMEGTTQQTHFLEDSLETDPDIEVQSLYFPQRVRDFKAAKELPYRIDNKKRRVYNVSHPRRGYPQSLEDMLQYDVVINSDIYRQAFTQEQLDNTVALVEEYGGGFIMIGGVTAFGAGRYDETVIDKLMPVDVEGTRDFEWEYFRAMVPEKALSHPIMQIGETAEETRKAWESLPSLGGLNRTKRPKPGAIALARHSVKKNEYGNYIVFAVQQIGRGRTMAFTSDTTDDWGMHFQRKFGTEEDATIYYRRFWNNAIRWLAADRIKRKNGELTVNADQSHADIGQSAKLTVRAPENVPPGNVQLRCKDPDGEQRLIELNHDALAQTLSADVPFDQAGSHTFTARMQKSQGVVLFAKCLVTVDEDRREESTTKANPQLMNELAGITNASSLDDKDAEYIATTLGELGTEYIEYKEQSAWDRLPILLLLLLVLGTEWLLRRRSGFA